MHKGIDLLGGRTNSAEEIIGPTRKFSGYNYSFPSYTDLGPPVSKNPPGVSPENLQTLKFEGTGRRRGRDNTISLILLVLQ